MVMAIATMMIVAMTGLTALMLRLNDFIFSFLPSFLGFVGMLEADALLNLVTHDILLLMCRTKLPKKRQKRNLLKS
jgi:cell division protein FtsW (lipid II flippase)